MQIFLIYQIGCLIGLSDLSPDIDHYFFRKILQAYPPPPPKKKKKVCFLHVTVWHSDGPNVFLKENKSTDNKKHIKLASMLLVKHSQDFS